MIHSVKIIGYRGFARFEMGGLGRINLLVGRNNSGKTSVLEALYLLSTSGDPYALWQLCGRRGERFVDEREPRYAPDSEIDVSHLFTGHELTVEREFSIVTKNQGPERSITVTIDEPNERERGEALPLPAVEDGVIPRPRLVLHIKTSPPKVSRAVPLTRKGGIAYDSIETPGRRVARSTQRPATATHYISTESLTADELIRLWDKIQLTPNEELVLRALQFVDPKIEQLRATASARYYGGRGGFIIKREDFSQPFPLGSLGDGAWRMLAMAIVITQCANGVLFVDEIDTGLHYTVMADMWKLIHVAAKEFNVQVFATTHSYDCVHSLAAICRSDPATGSEVSIQRIEADRSAAVRFTEPQIKIAAERQIEVR